MTREITKQALEAAIVRNCSPMLAGLKPACLFTFPGVFLAQGEHVDKQGLARSNRARLLEELEPCAKALAPSGISLRVLTWRSCGALVYVYRPAMLRRWIADPHAARPLREMGYTASDLERDLDRLAQRLGGETAPRDEKADCPMTCKHAGGRCKKDFPHEIGYFLGYPYEDVAGFIRHKGERYLAFGQWKVYANVSGALETFARYKRCTADTTSAYRSGRDLGSLAVAAM